MLKKYLGKTGKILFIVFVFLPQLALAQEVLPEAQATTPETIAAPALPTQSQADQGLPPIPSAPGGEPAGNVACFDYYRFGSVQADFESSLAQTVPGADIAFTGQVKNQNDYPLVNGTLYFKIFRRDEASFSQGDGNVLVDQFTLPDTFTLAAQGEKPFTFTWHVPELALGGEYYATAFFATEGRYNLLGLSFTDDVVGNQAQFSVTSDTPALAASFDRTSVTLNDQDHHFAAFPLHFAASDTVTAKMKLVNPTSESKVIRLTWKEYAWDALRPENQRNQEYELIELAPNESKELAYQFESKSDAVSYLVVEADDQGAKSLLDIRFVRDGIQETRINFPSILKYPLKPGEQNSLFACAHSTNEPVVPGNILTLALRDEQGNVLHTYKYEGDITGAMGGWKDDFTPASYLSNFTLTATLERENQVVEEVSIKYACNDIDPNLCEAKGGAAKEWLAGPKGTAILLIGLLTALALAAIAIVKMRGRKGIRRFGAILFMLTVASGFMAGGEKAEAKSAVWSNDISESFIYRWNYIEGVATDDRTNQTQYPQTAGWANALKGVHVDISYEANVYNADTNTLISDGAQIPVGTRIRFQAKAYDDSDISWFGAGYSNDSPNGHWNAGPPPATCDQADNVGTLAGGCCCRASCAHSSQYRSSYQQYKRKRPRLGERGRRGVPSHVCRLYPGECQF
ncbi:MAG: hypothetical protein WDN67_03120 [Candidatus Moraniibacteriota bacterium]